LWRITTSAFFVLQCDEGAAMRILKIGIGVAIGGWGTALCGCDVLLSDRGHRQYAQPEYVEQQPQYVQPQPQYVDPQPQYVIVQQAPPPVIVESQPPPPPGFQVWIGGSWDWTGQRYNWRPGRYERPPQQDAVWIAPRYERDVHGYRYTPGQWKKQNGHHDQNQGRDNH
jgi:hypothetical protein